MLRFHLSAPALDDRIGSLVHPGAASDPVLRRRHLVFMVERLALAFAALGLIPIYLVLTGRPDALALTVLAALILPLGAVAILSRTGRLPLAQAMSSAAFALLIGCFCMASGAMASPALVAFALLPLEAARTGSRAAVFGTAGLGLASLLAIVSGSLLGLAPAAVSSGFAQAGFAVAALVCCTGAALHLVSLESRNRADARSARQNDAALIAALGSPVVWQDAGGHVTRVSPSTEALFGASERQLSGRGLFERVHVGDRPAYLKAIADVAHRGEASPVVVRMHLAPALIEPPRRGVPDRQAPVTLWIEVRSQRLEPVSGAAAGIVTVLKDVTALHQEDASRAEAQQNEEAQTLRRSRFMATVSHELRTPLTAIIGFADLLGSDAGEIAGPERRRDYAGIIRTSGEHLLELVGALADVSRVESGSFGFAPSAIEPGRLADDCCDIIELSAAQAGIEIERDWSGDLPDVVADPRACRQILINLLSNAVKFTPRKGRVTVSLRRMGGELLIAVRDTGIGIAEGDLPRLGDPFFQGRPFRGAQAPAELPEGSGLGLSVVRALVGLHRGRMTVETQAGAGTCVRVVLPLACDHQGEAGHPAAIVPVSPAASGMPAQIADAALKAGEPTAYPALVQTLKRSA